MSEAPDQNPEPAYFSAGFTGPPKRNWKPWIFAAAGILVAALVAVVSISLTADDGSGDGGGRADAGGSAATGDRRSDVDPNSPTAVATAVVEALNDRDEDSISQVMCGARIPNVLRHIEQQADDVDTRASLKGFATVTDESATALVILTIGYQGTSNDLDFELYLDNESGTWCAEQFAGPAEYTQG